MRHTESPRVDGRSHVGRLLVALALGVLPASGVIAATAVPLDVDPGTAAKIARERGKQTRERANGEFTNANTGECGNISIGNSDSDAQNARARLNPRDTTIIITGDLINVPRCR
ncbi:MAG: hypothetical protein R3E48_16310 [Burkholderiaceae bacterium]